MDNTASQTGLFDLVFRGQLTPGVTEVQAQANMAQLFKMPADKVAGLFRGGNVTLKKGLEKSAALRYQAAIAQAGAVVELVAIVLASAEAPPVKPAPVAAPAQRPLAQPGSTTHERHVPKIAETEGEWSLRATGADLLTAGEKNAQVSRLHEFADFELRSLGGNLLDAREVERQQPLDIPQIDFGLAPPGADVLTPAERSAPVEAAVKPGNWQVAAAGERLSAVTSSSPTPPNVDHLTLQK